MITIKIGDVFQRTYRPERRVKIIRYYEDTEIVVYKIISDDIKAFINEIMQLHINVFMDRYKLVYQVEGFEV